MNALLVLIGAFVTHAHATAIEQLGSGAPGIDDMWAELKSFFPYTDMGSAGLAFLLLIITNFILRFIGGCAALMIVWGGVKMVTTIASETAHDDAKKIVQYACIGLILAMGADAIVMYVMYVTRLASGG